MSESPTVTRPRQSTAIPTGSMNWPGAVPRSPKAVTGVPSAVNSCTRSLPRSTTHTFPAASVAIPLAERSWPSFEPVEPNSARSPPEAVETVIVLRAASTPYTREPSGETAMPRSERNWPKEPRWVPAVLKRTIRPLPSSAT